MMNPETFRAVNAIATGVSLGRKCVTNVLTAETPIALSAST